MIVSSTMYTQYCPVRQTKMPTMHVYYVPIHQTSCSPNIPCSYMVYVTVTSYFQWKQLVASSYVTSQLCFKSNADPNCGPGPGPEDHINHNMYGMFIILVVFHITVKMMVLSVKNDYLH